MKPAYVGIDVAFAKEKLLPISICSWREGRLVPYPLRQLSYCPPRGHGNVATLDDAVVRSFARKTREYLERVAQELDLQFVRIAIDAPLAPTLPGRSRRAAEEALDAAGVSCFATPSAEGFVEIARKVREHLGAGGSVSTLPHSNQLWMLVGFALFDELVSLAPCIEVFPQATIRAIGSGRVHKSTPGAVAAQLAAASRFTRWPTTEQDLPLHYCTWGDPHDQLDAYLSAWVAALDDGDRRALGIPPDDVIWVPAVNVTLLEGDAPPVALASRRLAATRPPRREHEQPTDGFPCPACELHIFRRWPWGWDAHAAHTCAGLEATDPSERKEEYRRRFAVHFS